MSLDHITSFWFSSVSYNIFIVVFPENYLFTQQLTRLCSTNNYKTCFKQLLNSSRTNTRGYFQADVLHFFMCGERTASVILFSHTNASYHKLDCFQSQNVNNLFCTLFSLVCSMQRTISPEASSYSKSLCIWLFLRKLCRCKM